MRLQRPAVRTDYQLPEMARYLNSYLLDIYTAFAGIDTSGGGVTDGDKGDVTVSGSGTVWTVDVKPNKLTATLDFGASFTDKASLVVTGQSWVTSTSVIVPSVLSTNVDESYLLDIKPVISDIVNGVGFTITLWSEPEAKGTYSVMCVGVA